MYIISDRHFYCRPQPEATERLLQQMSDATIERLMYEDPTDQKIFLPYLVDLYSRLPAKDRWGIESDKTHKYNHTKQEDGWGPGYLWATRLLGGIYGDCISVLDEKHLKRLGDVHGQTYKVPDKRVCLPYINRITGAEDFTYALALISAAAHNTENPLIAAWTAEHSIMGTTRLTPAYQALALNIVAMPLVLHSQDGVRRTVAKELTKATASLDASIQPSVLSILDYMADKDPSESVRLMTVCMLNSACRLPADLQPRAMEFVRLLDLKSNAGLYHLAALETFAENIHNMAAEHQPAAIDIVLKAMQTPREVENQPTLHSVNLHSKLAEKFLPTICRLPPENQAKGMEVAAVCMNTPVLHALVMECLLTEPGTLTPAVQDTCLSMVERVVDTREYFGCSLIAEHLFEGIDNIDPEHHARVTGFAEILASHPARDVRESAIDYLRDMRQTGPVRYFTQRKPRPAANAR